MRILNLPVLCLNREWLPIEVKTLRDAITALTGDSIKGAPSLAIDQDFNFFGDGTPDWDSPTRCVPILWDSWINLQTRPWDVVIRTARLRIRAPRVIIQPGFSKIPFVTQKATRAAIFKRDGLIDQYTGKQLTRATANIDHVIPRDRGGKNTFENMVVCDSALNSMKANRTPEEAGLKLIRKPVAPLPIPLSSTIRTVSHPSWKMFLPQLNK